MKTAYLLDTNIVSELRKPKPHGAVVAWLQALEDSQLYVSAVTLGEIQAGIEMTREQDPAKTSEIETWLHQLAGSCNILPMDANAFRAWAKLMLRKSDTLYEDAMIAATASSHGLRVATRNVADFEALGMRVLNPFEAQPAGGWTRRPNSAGQNRFIGLHWSCLAKLWLGSWRARPLAWPF